MNDNELFELCKSVYEKTGWLPSDKNTLFVYDGGQLFSTMTGSNSPLYTSDYLLEKLPRYMGDGMLELTTKQGQVRNGWMAFYSDEDGYSTEREGIADTPLKALLKLTLALHEAGELE